MKRNTKISCDVSREADNMLKAYCVKHERSKGFLLEKMIRKFCGGDTEPQGKDPHQVPKSEIIKPKNPVKRFKEPTVEEVKEYCDSRCNNVDAQTFVDHYSASGWMRGKNKIKNWKACVHTWEKTTGAQQTRGGGKTSGNLSACEDFING